MLEVIATHRAKAGDIPTDFHTSELFRGYLNAYWLRPESALLQFAEAEIIAEHWERIYEPPLLDLGCGNGVNMSLIAGWVFGNDFDVYSSLDLGAMDIYDSIPDMSAPAPIKVKGTHIDLGLDIRTAMTRQTVNLGTFGNVIQGDASSIPFGDGQVGTIYSNLLRDFDDGPLETVMSECRRLLKKGGRLVISCPTERYKKSLYYAPRALALESSGKIEEAQRYLKLDRGRSVFCSQQVSASTWEKRLQKFGLELEEVVYYGSDFLMEFWDTGLRPFSMYIAEWVRLFRDSPIFSHVKAGVVKTMEYLLQPMLTSLRDPNGAFMVLIAKRV
jgi:SAM-dependent methyltransferase